MDPQPPDPSPPLNDEFESSRENEAEESSSVPSGPDPDPGFYAGALRRIPIWMAIVAGAALPVVWWKLGALGAASFVAGAIGGYWNYVGICRIADRLSQTVARTGRAPKSGARGFLRLLFIVLAAFVIIRFTHINLVAAFLGLFTPVVAVVLEILYELTARK
jgi:hypothetical protein